MRQQGEPLLDLGRQQVRRELQDAFLVCGVARQGRELKGDHDAVAIPYNNLFTHQVSSWWRSRSTPNFVASHGALILV